MKEIILKFEIKVVPGMRITYLCVHNTELDKKALDKFINAENTLYKGELTIKIMTNKVRFEMEGVSKNTNITQTLNFTIGDKKVFKEDQEFTVKSTGRISWVKENIKLPL